MSTPKLPYKFTFFKSVQSIYEESINKKMEAMFFFQGLAEREQNEHEEPNNELLKTMANHFQMLSSILAFNISLEKSALTEMEKIQFTNPRAN